jgi:hypothetical protein
VSAEVQINRGRERERERETGNPGNSHLAVGHVTVVVSRLDFIKWRIALNAVKCKWV